MFKHNLLFLSLLFLTILESTITEETDDRENVASNGGESSIMTGNNARDDQDLYQIGVGIADITGPAAEVNMMGYAKLSQDASGIHFRLYSRAFIIMDGDGKRVVYVSADLGMISQAIKIQVTNVLEKKYNGLYTEKNVMLSGTHTHSGPAGYLQYVLYIITSQGFVWQNFNAIVDGIVRSIDRAHESAKFGHIYYNEGRLDDVSINRSPTAYLNNPEDERAKYQSDTDLVMHLLKFTDAKGVPIGAITWYPVHPTSMNNTNTLISGDNKGYASMLFEKDINTKSDNSTEENGIIKNNYYLPGKGPFVAAFANANLGDVSPNIKGPHCLDTGLPCDILTSTCGGKNMNCAAQGPGQNMFESTAIIAERQYLKAKYLFDNAKEKIAGPINFIHQHLDMSATVVDLGNQTVKTCKPAMGYSFAAGTIDGPGALDFKQGTTKSNNFWNLVRDFISAPTKELIDCHAPKPILLATGQMHYPYEWQPSIVPSQIFKIGSVVIAGVPSEFTTMSGRRMREALIEEFDGPQGIINYFRRPNRTKDKLNGTKVILSGLTNAYSSYVATFEEYQAQRYEGASTIFGPHTLAAYIQQFKKLAKNLIAGTSVDGGPEPPNLLGKQISLRPGVVFDAPPFGKHFGAVIHDAEDEYYTGSQVSVTFVSGHPKNDLMTEKTFLTVEKFNENSVSDWDVIATDANWETKFIWNRTNSLLGQSHATVLWDIPKDAEQGTYRITHSGHSKSLLQKISPYTGISKVFKVVKRSETPMMFM